MCGPCWAAHGGKPDAAEIGPTPVETAPLRYPTGQRQWLSALKRADWVAEIRVDGRRNLLAIARQLALHADWNTLESMPGWDTVSAKTGTSETTVQRWVQELKLHGWIAVVESGSTPLTRPMAMTLPDGSVVSRDDGNRRAVYALRLPLSPAEAVRRAVEEVVVQAQRVAGGTLPAGACPSTGKTPSEQGKRDSAGDEKGWPSWSVPKEQTRQVGSYARERRLVDHSHRSMPVLQGRNNQTDALRARLDRQNGPDFMIIAPSSGFEMLVAAEQLRRRLPILARLTRRAVRAACRPFWRAGWTNLDLVHAMDHLPSVFGTRADTPSTCPPDHTGPRTAWWWVSTRLAAWRDPAGRPHCGFYQTRRRRKALRDAIATRHGRAALDIMGIADLAADPILTPGRIAAYGRRAAKQLSPPLTPARPCQLTAPGASQHVRNAATAQLHARLDQQHVRRAAAAQRHAELMASLKPHLDAARTELAKNTGTSASALAPPQEKLTPRQRYERARARAAGYRRNRRRER